MDFNLDKLRAFIVVARMGNLSSAAKELGTTQPNLGRQMTALQNEVNLTLFFRHSRGLSLTKHGEDFLNVCKDIVGQLIQKVDIIREKDLFPEGNLKIITGLGTTEEILGSLAKFSNKFPKVDFTFLSTIEIYQFHIGEADVGIIPIYYSDPDIVQEILYESRLRIYASPYYLEKNSIPKCIEDLKLHKLIVYNSKDENLEEINIHLKNIDHKLYNFINVNNGLSLRKALLSGLGIGPYEYNRELIKNNLLIDIFPDIPDHKIPYYFTYHRRLEGSPKIKAFHEFLKKEVINSWIDPHK